MLGPSATSWNAHHVAGARPGRSSCRGLQGLAFRRLAAFRNGSDGSWQRVFFGHRMSENSSNMDTTRRRKILEERGREWPLGWCNHLLIERTMKPKEATGQLDCNEGFIFLGRNFLKKTTIPLSYADRRRQSVPLRKQMRAG